MLLLSLPLPRMSPDPKPHFQSRHRERELVGSSDKHLSRKVPGVQGQIWCVVRATSLFYSLTSPIYLWVSSYKVTNTIVEHHHYDPRPCQGSTSKYHGGL